MLKPSPRATYLHRFLHSLERLPPKERSDNFLEYSQAQEQSDLYLGNKTCLQILSVLTKTVFLLTRNNLSIFSHPIHKLMCVERFSSLPFQSKIEEVFSTEKKVFLYKSSAQLPLLNTPGYLDTISGVSHSSSLYSHDAKPDVLAFRVPCSRRSFGASFLWLLLCVLHAISDALYFVLRDVSDAIFSGAQSLYRGFLGNFLYSSYALFRGFYNNIRGLPDDDAPLLSLWFLAYPMRSITGNNNYKMI